MKYAYYPGCSLHSSASEYNDSIKAVCNKLDIDLWEIPGWTCCGASSAHSVDHLLGLAIPARNLIEAEKEGLDVLAPCAACWQRLVRVNQEIKQSPEMKEKISKAVGTEIKGTSKIVSMFEAVLATNLSNIAEKVTRPLKGLKIACYYGCYYLKPPKLTGLDNPENPHLLDDIMQTCGAETVNWPYKTECCGASLVFYDVNTVLGMSKRVLNVARNANVDAIVTACPLCQSNLDMRQGQINKHLGTDFNIPIFYFTELLAYAMGVSPKEFGIDKHCVDARNVLKKVQNS